MRTTLDLDEDILEVTRQLARQHGRTIGQMASELIRRALQRKDVKSRNGIPLLRPKAGAPKPTLELINRLRDGE